MDTGFGRRINYFKYLATDLASIDHDNVKGLIDRGALNGEMFWLSRKFFQYLKAHPRNTTRIFPRPPRIVKETEDLLQRKLPKLIGRFLLTWSEPALRYSEATRIGNITTIIETKFKLTLPVAKLMIEQAGIQDRSL